MCRSVGLEAVRRRRLRPSGKDGELRADRPGGTRSGDAPVRRRGGTHSEGETVRFTERAIVRRAIETLHLTLYCIVYNVMSFIRQWRRFPSHLEVQTALQTSNTASRSGPESTTTEQRQASSHQIFFTGRPSLSHQAEPVHVANTGPGHPGITERRRLYCMATRIQRRFHVI
jgi:hypothetical protein